MAFQSTTTIARVLEKLNLPAFPAALMGAGIMFGVGLTKEVVFDPVFDPSDLVAGGIGASIGFLTILLWPGKDGASSWLSMDAEGGAAWFSPLGGSSPSQPPRSLMLHVQNTFWIRRAVGLHVFSGGIEMAFQDDSPKRLLFGAGLRFSLYPFLFLWKPTKAPPSLSIWGGVDYGYLLFSLSKDVSYPAAGYTPFYSLGLKWKPTKTAFFLTAETMLIPYSGTLLIAPGAQLGMEL